MFANDRDFWVEMIRFASSVIAAVLILFGYKWANGWHKEKKKPARRRSRRAGKGKPGAGRRKRPA